ncbi:SDR family oxidoreductase [Flavobacterium amnicola]|uniref:SDR family oxidoreductase n=1 Tax=Flavobacterium amnicola TaxID=2506422 RepID=A0A4Q1K5S5_9FLAO|nr:SDR family oxidoreductase [Flavobacterium amnicola]
MNVSILGCGWLGFPLAKRLIENGFSVNGSTTSIAKLKVLEEENIVPFLIELSEEKIIGTISDFLSNADVLIIDIPPKLRGEQKENFVRKIQNLIPHIETSKIEKVLFVSSTSVYGEDEAIVTEETIPCPDTESGKQLAQVEKILKFNPNFKTTVLRFGGLIGADRHPIKFLAGKENLENPNAPVNLIHQKDCIALIEKIISMDCFAEVFNAVAPFHPTRKNYYTKKALELHLEVPKFKEHSEKGKIIDSTKIITLLNHSFALDLY